VKIAALLIVLALALAAVFLGGEQLRLCTEILYLGLFAISFNFLFNYLGLLSFGPNATYGAAAYAFAMLTAQQPSLPLAVAGLLAIAAGAFVGLIGALISVRLKGGYFALMTLAYCQLLYFCAEKFYSVTHGDDGLMVMSSPTIPFVNPDLLSHDQTLYLIALATVVTCSAALYWFLGTPLGRAAVLVKSNEERARFLGYNVVAIKIAVMTMTSVVAGAAGILFALFQGLVSPALLSFAPVGDVIFMSLLGGTSSLFAPFVGTVAFTLLEDQMSDLTSHWRLIVATLSIGLVLFLPDGLTGLAGRLRERFLIARRPDPTGEAGA
jgi:branched-chain amino acid transport system permease protein